MLRTLKDLQGYAIRATDGDIGHVADVYFDECIGPITRSPPMRPGRG